MNKKKVIALIMVFVMTFVLLNIPETQVTAEGDTCSNGHEWAGKYGADEGFHWRVCSECGEAWETKEGHNMMSAMQMTESGEAGQVNICSVCGYTTDTSGNHIHTYAPTWTWDMVDPDIEVGASASCTLTCKFCDASKGSVEADIDYEETISPDCETTGEGVYTAEAVFGAGTDWPESYQDSKTVTLPAYGHSWYQDGDTQWDEQTGMATMHFACEMNQTHVTGVAIAYQSINTATCTQEGVTYKTVQVTLGNFEYEDQTESLTTAALGHDWGEVEWNWREFDEDYPEPSTAPQMTCNRCEEENYPVEGMVYYEEKDIPAGCETDGGKYYEASAEFVLNSDDDIRRICTDMAVAVQYQALGHVWQKPSWEWGDEIATASAICTREAAVTHTTHAAVQCQTIHTATCTQAGVTWQEASAQIGSQTYAASSVAAEEAAIGHDPGDAAQWEWNLEDEDNPKASVSAACKNCSELLQVDATVTLAAVTAASCETNGAKLYHATAGIDLGNGAGAVPNEKTYTANTTIVLLATGHDWGDWEEATAAGCETTGESVRKCQNDSSHIEIQELPAIGHDWSDWVTSQAAGCETTGEAVSTCQNDSAHTRTQELPAIGHNWGDWEEATAAGCETTGESVRKCQNDSSHIETQELPPIGHKWGDWVEITSAGCEISGESVRICQNDGSHTETQELPPTGHTLDDPFWSWDLTDPSAPSAVVSVSCKICGGVLNTSQAYVTKTVTAASCDIDGREFYQATATMNIGNDSSPDERTYTANTTVVLQATGHTYTTEWSTDSTSHWHYCTTCGDITAKAEHHSSQPATELTDEVCDICGYVMAEKLPVTSTAPTVQPTEPSEQPTEPTVQPTEPSEQPTEPTVQPTEPSEQPTEPTVQPTEPSKQPTEPTVQPMEPSKQPMEPSEQPTEPTVQPSKPSQQPAEPTVQPTKPAGQSIKSTEQPTEKPTEPSLQPVNPTVQSIKPSEQPVMPTVLPFTIAGLPVTPTVLPAAPSDVPSVPQEVLYTVSERPVKASVFFRNTGNLKVSDLTFVKDGQANTYAFNLPQQTPTRDGFYFEGWENSVEAGYFQPGEALEYSYDDYSSLTFSAIWTQMLRAGNYDLDSSTRYHLAQGNYLIDGDDTVYEGDQTVYPKNGGNYTIREGR